MLVRCLYASRATGKIDDGTLDAILKQSRRNNPKSGITGMLCVSGGVFVQVIEGGRVEVNRLLGALFRDQRHSGVEVLSFEEIGERRFSNWSMGQVKLSAVNPALLLKYSAKAELNPFDCTSSGTLALLHELAESGGIEHRPA